MKKLLLILIVGLLLSGCSLFEEEYKMEKSSDELVSEGSSAFMSGDYKTAAQPTELRWLECLAAKRTNITKLATLAIRNENFPVSICRSEQFPSNRLESHWFAVNLQYPSCGHVSVSLHWNLASSVRR